MSVILSIMFLLLLLMTTTVHCQLDNEMVADFTDKEMFIQNGDFGLYLLQAEEDYHVSVSGGGVGTCPITSELQLTYDGQLKINNHIVNATASIPPLLQLLLLPPINSMEEVYLCYNFTTERITLKVAIGILALLFLASHGGKIRTAVGAIDKDLLRSQFARRFSRTRSPVARGSGTYTPVEEEASL